jgi:hypothetical protein
MTDTTTQPDAPAELAPLWPGDFSLQNILVSGEFGVGKTLFGLLLDPEGKTAHIDIEDSSESYVGKIPFDRFDLPAMLAAAYPAGNARPLHLWQLFEKTIQDIPPGKYRVGVLDPVTEIEDALVDYIRRNPAKFGLTPNQVDASPALLWGAMKSEWKRFLLYANTKFETFAIIAHNKAVFKGGKPVPGKRTAKGKETLSEITSLQIELFRSLDSSGKRPAIPSGVLGKSRMIATQVVKGELQIVEVLPDRLPEATGNAIREYMKNPVGLKKTRRKGETVEVETMSEDDRLLLSREIAEEEARAAEARLEQARIESRKNEKQEEPVIASVEGNPTGSTEGLFSGAKAETGSPEVTQPETEIASPETVGDTLPETPPGDPVEAPPFEVDEKPDENREGLATDEQLSRLVELKKVLSIPSESWKNILAKRDVETARDLWAEQADALIAALLEKAQIAEKLDELDVWAKSVLPK